MEDERNNQYQQGGETHDEKSADQVEVKERGVLNTLLGRKKPEDQEKKQEEELVSGMENVKVSEPEKHDEVKKEEHQGGEKKESLLDKLHRTSSSSSSSSDEEEEVIDDNGEVVKRKKKKGLKEKIKEKLPGRKDQDVEGEHKPYAPTPVPAPTHAHHQEPEHKPPAPPAAVETHAYKDDDDHKAYIPASAPAPAPVTTHVHDDGAAVVVQKVEATPEEEKKGLLEKIKEKLPGGHKKPEDAAAAPADHHAPAPHAEDVGSPDGKEKKQGFLGKIMDKIPGYNKTPAAEEDHKHADAGEHKTSSS